MGWNAEHTAASASATGSDRTLVAGLKGLHVEGTFNGGRREQVILQIKPAAGSYVEIADMSEDGHMNFELAEDCTCRVNLVNVDSTSSITVYMSDT